MGVPQIVEANAGDPGHLQRTGEGMGDGRGVKGFVAGMTEDKVGFGQRSYQKNTLRLLCQPMVLKDLHREAGSEIRRRLPLLLGSLNSQTPLRLKRARITDSEP